MNLGLEKIRGQRGKLPVQPLGYVNSTKVIYGGALERKYVEVCFPRGPHQGRPRSDVLSESKIMADNVEIQFVDESEFQNDGKWYFYIDNSQLHSVRTSRKTHFCFRLRLKITLEESPNPSRRPQCPSLSHHFLLPWDMTTK